MPLLGQWGGFRYKCFRIASLFSDPIFLLLFWRPCNLLSWLFIVWIKGWSTR